MVASAEANPPSLLRRNSMKKYVLKRLLSLIPTIFIVSVVIFLLVHLTPGDPAAAMLGEDATAAEIAALHTQLGLDDPLVEQKNH